MAAASPGATLEEADLWVLPCLSYLVSTLGSDWCWLLLSSLPFLSLGLVATL